MKDIKLAGDHTTLTQLARKLVRELNKYPCVDRISPGVSANKHARSRHVKIRKNGVFSLTFTVVGGGIQEFLVVCNKRKKNSVEETTRVTKKWARKNHLKFRYKDSSSATV